MLFSAGLDSAVLLADAARRGPALPLYIVTGLAWEAEERGMARRLLSHAPFAGVVQPMVELSFDMRDVYPPQHWAVQGTPPAFDTPDEDVFIEGRNVILLSKAAVYAHAHGVHTLLMGQLAGNPFPDATPEFLQAIERALSLGLGAEVRVETPLSSMHKADVIRLGMELGVPFERTLSCMQPAEGRHCGRCSKCRERRDGFREAGVPDPTPYRQTPLR